jgi:hypothetical protein
MRPPGKLPSAFAGVLRVEVGVPAVDVGAGDGVGMSSASASAALYPQPDGAFSR